MKLGCLLKPVVKNKMVCEATFKKKKKKSVFIRKLSLQQQNIKDVNSLTEFNILYNSQQEY